MFVRNWGLIHTHDMCQPACFPTELKLLFFQRILITPSFTTRIQNVFSHISTSYFISHQNIHKWRDMRQGKKIKTLLFLHRTHTHIYIYDIKQDYHLFIGSKIWQIKSKTKNIKFVVCFQCRGVLVL